MIYQKNTTKHYKVSVYGVFLFPLPAYRYI